MQFRPKTKLRPNLTPYLRPKPKINNAKCITFIHVSNLRVNHRLKLNRWMLYIHEEEQLLSVLAKEIITAPISLCPAELNSCSLGVLVGGADKYFRAAISSSTLTKKSQIGQDFVTLQFSQDKKHNAQCKSQANNKAAASFTNPSHHRSSLSPGLTQWTLAAHRFLAYLDLFWFRAVD